MESPLRLLVVGVGGQGALTAARCLGAAAEAAGLDSRLGQLHGMAQRGGSVESTVVIGPGKSAFIGRGAADILLGLEPLEVLRARERMTPKTRVVMSTGKIVPHTLSQRGESYPDMDGILERVRAVAGELVTVDGPALTEQVGDARSLNMLMLGALAGLGALPFGGEVLWGAIKEMTRPSLHAANHKVFELGKEAVA